MIRSFFYGLLISALALGPAPVFAGPCQTLNYSRVATHYVGPTINHQVYQGHAAYGTPGYLQSYPVIQEVFRTEALYSSGQYLQNQALEEALKLVQQMQAQLNAKGANIPEGKTGLNSELETILRGIPKPKGASYGPRDVQGIVNDACVHCHNGKKHPLNLSDLTKLTSDEKVAIHDAVVLERTMPPKGKGDLTKEEIRTIAKELR